MLYVILKGRWCDDIVLNAHVPNDDKDDDIRDSFYKELEQVFDHHMKILVGDFTAKVGREDIFKLIIGNKSLHEVSDDTEVRVVNFATSQNDIPKTMS
jgi:hypothetical protein